MTTLREAAQQAIALICSARLCEVNSMSSRQEMLRLMIEATDTLRAALAEPVQEPVAWRWGYRSITTGEMDWRGYVEIAADPNLRSPAIIMEPLYTAPPQRKPLTDEEIKRLVSNDMVQFARAIEQAHGIV